MRRAKLKILIILAPIFLIAGCRPDIIDISNIKIERKGVNLDIMIKNPNIVPLTLSDIKMDLFIDGYKFKDLIYKPKIRLKPLSQEYYPVIVDIKPLKHPYASTGAFMSLITQDSTQIIIQGSVLVKSFLFKKRINFSENIYIKYKK